MINRVPWPLPAILVWLLAWGTLLGLRLAGHTVLIGLLAAALVGVMGSVWGGTRMRRLIIALGFPLSWGVASGTLALAPWVWLVALAVLLLLYPPSTWRDAPVYPTPADAFEGLRDRVPLHWGVDVLDAGCGLGHGLVALERAWPDVRLHGIERSWPLALACRLRCRWAQVRQGDFWAESWARYDLVYVFQRPETLPRALAKAHQDMRPGTWLASLEFADAQQPPTLTWTCPDGRPLWLYQMPFQAGTPVAAEVPDAPGAAG